MKKILILLFVICGAISSRSQELVANGGTGLYYTVPNAIMTGGITSSSAMQQLALGLSGQVLTSTGNGLATWQLTPGGVVLGADSATTGQALIGSPLQFTTGANQRYKVSGTIIATSSSAAGIKLGCRIPSGDTGYFVFTGTDTTTLQTNWSAVTADSGLTATYGQLNGTCYINFEGIVSGPTAGAFIVGFLKGTSGTATLKQWSSLGWKRIY